MNLRPIDGHTAATLLAGLESLDPAGMLTADELRARCSAGECFEATAGEASAVVVTHTVNGVLWIEALRGSGAGDADFLNAVDAALQAHARRRGLHRIAMQTPRRGLLDRALRRGWDVRGWVLAKELQ